MTNYITQARRTKIAQHLLWKIAQGAFEVLPAGCAGRQRRCGWFDAALVRQTCITSGVSGIALTKLDVLDGFDTLKICTGYRLDGEVIDFLPTAAAKQARVEPVYEEMPGWSTSTEGARRWRDLPAEAIKYIKRVEELIETPVALLSTSPERDDTILVTDPFAD